MATLSGKQRGKMPASSFAGGKPKGDKEGRFPINDAAHVRNALARIRFATPAEASRIRSKAKSMGIGKPANKK